MPRVLVFDVNETLLDLQVLDPYFIRIFGTKNVRMAWFQQLLRLAMVTNLTQTYYDFTTLATEALDMTARRYDVPLSADDIMAIRTTMRQLPPHPEVTESLDRLRSAGLRMVALTNSTPDAALAQLRFAGLVQYFDQIFSVDAVRRFKPAPEPYRMVQEALGLPPHGLRLVAAHDWDIAGAMAVGWAGAFVARPGKVMGTLAFRPDIQGHTLADVTDQILAAASREVVGK